MAESLAYQCEAVASTCLEEEAESSACPFKAKFVAFQKMLAASPVDLYEAGFEVSQAFLDQGWVLETHPWAETLQALLSRSKAYQKVACL